MKLLETTENQIYTLVDIGNDAHFSRRAKSMGLAAGTKIRVIRKQDKMPILLFAKDTLIAVNRKDAEGIEVNINV